MLNFRIEEKVNYENENFVLITSIDMERVLISFFFKLELSLKFLVFVNILDRSLFTKNIKAKAG